MVSRLDLGNGEYLNYVNRLEWKAKLPLEFWERLKPPVSRVRFAYTGKEFCTNTAGCIKHLQDLQEFYMSKLKPDMPYNFLVGGDGCVYEGAGWDNNAARDPRHFWLKRKTVVIAYIGNFVKENPPNDMLFMAMDLIKYGLKEKIIHPLFKLVPEKKHGESRKGTENHETEDEIKEQPE